MPASPPRASSAAIDAESRLSLGSPDRPEREGRADCPSEDHPGDGSGEDRRKHGGQRGDDPLPAGEADGFEHGGIARTPLEVPRDRLGHDDRAGGGSDGGEQEQRVALQRRRPLDRLDVHLLVRGVAEVPDHGREVGGRAPPGRRRRRCAATGSCPAARRAASDRRRASVRRGRRAGHPGRRRGPRSGGRCRRRRHLRCSPPRTRGTPAPTAGHGRRRRCPHAVRRAR